MAFEVRGEPQTVQHIDGEDTILNDPLLVTVLDFNRRALDQLAHALHLTVKHTYNHAPGIDKGNFFKGREDRGVNPSHDSSGSDVYYLLKNMKSHVDLYASLLVTDDNTLEETIDFLLDTIRNGMAHQSYLGCTGDPESNNSQSACELKKNETTVKCLTKCNELITWIVRAAFYNVISSKIQKILDNIINMNGVFEDFKKVKQSLKSRLKNPHNATDTERALEKLDKVREALEEEENCDDSIDERPLTHFVNMVMLPRLREIRD